MTGWPAVAISLVLPWLAVTLWLRLLWTAPFPGPWLMLAGYGYVIAMIAVTLGLRLQGTLGFPLNVNAILLVSALLVGAALILLRRGPFVPPPPPAPDRPVMPPWQNILFALMLLWLILRLTGLILAISWQPLFPWDAWTTWEFRARTWTELKELVPFVSPRQWLDEPGQAWYSIDAWNYPPTVSLIATWPALAYGAWHETAANLPWLGSVLALAMGFYAQARQWGASPLTSILFLWLLLSLPMLNTHVALAGYADLWLATALGLGFMAFMLWLKENDWRQGLLAALLILSLPMIKQEGLVWALLFPAALMLAKANKITLAAIALSVITLGILVWYRGGLDINPFGLVSIKISPDLIQLPLLGEMRLVEDTAWEPILKHLFLYGNWHLLIYLVVLALIAAPGVMWRWPRHSWHRAGAFWALTSLSALYFLFAKTDAYDWALKGTSINRLTLQLAPLLLFWGMSVWIGLSDRGRTASGTASRHSRGTSK